MKSTACTPTVTTQPQLANGVVWYRDDASGLFVVASVFFEPERLRLCTAFDVDLLGLCTGEHEVGALAERLSVPVDRVIGTLTGWAHAGPGILRWLAATDRSPEAQRRRKAREAAVLDMFGAARAASAENTDNVRYHAAEIRDAADQFERVETTVSHFFSAPHPALGGRRYGEAFCDAVMASAGCRGPARILEIGCGTGRFARSYLDRLRERHGAFYASADYTLLDLSPELQSSQRTACDEHMARVRFLSGDVATYDFGAERFDLVIANEMIADLEAGRANTRRVHEGSAQTDAERLARDLGLDLHSAPAEVVINTGAIRLIARLPALLTKGGVAVLTEYGGPSSFPRAVKLKGHTEFSIHFGHLVRCAEHWGLRAELEALGTWLGFDPSSAVLAVCDFRLLSDHLLPFLGRAPLPTLAYGPEDLFRRLGELQEHLGNFRFLPLERWDSYNPFTDFHALVLHR